MIWDLEVSSEIVAGKGRIEFVITTKDHVFIFEFKLQGSGKKTLKHILDNKHYYEKYVKILIKTLLLWVYLSTIKIKN